MRRLIIAAALASTFALGALAGRVQLAPQPAAAAVSLTFTNPVGFASTNWDSVCIYNRDAAGQYRGVMAFAPAAPDGTRLPPLQSQRAVATLPADYQTFINSWVAFVRADFAAYN
jgi:hypothetical protein